MLVTAQSPESCQTFSCYPAITRRCRRKVTMINAAMRTALICIAPGERKLVTTQDPDTCQIGSLLSPASCTHLPGSKRKDSSDSLVPDTCQIASPCFVPALTCITTGWCQLSTLRPDPPLPMSMSDRQLPFCG